MLRGYSDGFVTSFYDFYGFEDKGTDETVDDLEARIASALGNPDNLISYIQLHEFEALLLSDAAVVADYFQAKSLNKIIRSAVISAGTPELVNDSPTSAPSKRLENWTQTHAPARHQYSKNTKTLHGPQLAARLTLPAIRSACPRFAAWLTQLENLARNAQAS